MKTSAKTLIAATALSLALPASAFADWTKTWVIEWYEPAHYYGAAEGVTEPGADCPAGTNPEIDWIAVLIRAGYTPEEAAWMRSPENPERSPVNGNPRMALRGENRANVYTDPTTYPDPGLTGVTGTVAEGVDLDGNLSNGFTSPAGARGIDNEFYRAMGCWKTYRGPPRQSSGALTFNDSMRNGSWTVVIVAAGEGDDPMNDPNAGLGIYMSADAVVKDGMGNVARDYTFRIRPDAKYEAVMPVRTEDGSIISTAAADVMLREPGYTRDLELLNARVNLQMQPDGSLKGHIGGYRPWEPVYRGWVAARGAVIESLTWVELPSVWYALERAADFSPTGPDGARTHISTAYRIDALPAYVVTPDATQDVAEVVSYKDLAPAAPARGLAALSAARAAGN